MRHEALASSPLAEGGGNLSMKIIVKFVVTFLACCFVTDTMVRGTGGPDSNQSSNDPNWAELIASMDKMHMAMSAVARSGNSDSDFVRLMLPHHQAAIDMAKTQLVHGKDPQMRRLAQEIITDQQLEIELMQRWLKQQQQQQQRTN